MQWKSDDAVQFRRVQATKYLQQNAIYCVYMCLHSNNEMKKLQHSSFLDAIIFTI